MAATLIFRMPRDARMHHTLREYFSIQTVTLLATWAVLMFLEWGKPHIVGNHFNPQWVLLGAIISAIVSAFLTDQHRAPTLWRYRRWVALGCGAIAWASVGRFVSSPLGWLAGAVVWASVLVALGTQHYTQDD